MRLPSTRKSISGPELVKVRLREGEAVREEVVELDSDEAGERLKAAVASEGLLTIHTEEASLESIFVKMTGRGLDG